MGKSARKKRNKKYVSRPAIEGLNHKMSQAVRATRKVLWANQSSCERLRTLMLAYPDFFSEDYCDWVVNAYHMGEVTYDSAVACVISEIALVYLQPSFVICGERRFRNEYDSTEDLDEILYPTPSVDPTTPNPPGHLLALSHIYFSEDCDTKYKAVVVHSVENLMVKAREAQELLDAGEITWTEIHGDCELDQPAAA